MRAEDAEEQEHRTQPHLSNICENGCLKSILSARCHILGSSMCRNIKILFNFEPPATDDEVRAAALQFIRKISGFTKPSKANEASFDAAVEEVTMVSRRLLYSLETTAPPKNREEEAAKAKARSQERFGRPA